MLTELFLVPYSFFFFFFALLDACPGAGSVAKGPRSQPISQQTFCSVDTVLFVSDSSKMFAEWILPT